MSKLIDLNEILYPNAVQMELAPTLLSFFLCVAMSFIVRDFYIKRSFSLTGKMHIGSIIPVLSAVVFLVIVVVKSSLALSLGLVGALSIVRFRTPIKEPEELVYLFLAIAIGLGYAAGQIMVTTVLTLSILFIIYVWLSNRKLEKTSEYNLVIKWKNEVLFDDILEGITPIVQNLKLVRLDTSPDNNTAVMLIIPNEDASIDILINKLRMMDENINITFFEAKTNW